MLRAFGLEAILVVIVIPLPASTSNVSSPTAIILSWPSTWIVLNPLPSETFTAPEPWSVTLNPV